jgi:hypothetical protein
MSKTQATTYETIVTKLELILNTLDDLMEDPLFMDTIHGEQELSLDLYYELMDTIITQFKPQETTTAYRPLLVDDSYDAE